MAGTILRCALRGSTGIALIALCAATAARAEVSISNQPTSDMSCTGGVCTATAPKAVLNVGDLANMLGSGDVAVKTGAIAKNIEVKQALSWTSTNRLTLDAQQSVTVDKPVTVAGTGALTITTNDGGTNGEFVIDEKSSVQLWDLSSSLVIDGKSYTLVGDIATLASDIAANPSGFYALAKPYDASVDGTYSSAPITTEFEGILDGLGNAISNLAINFPAEGEAIGLFAIVQKHGCVRNARLLNVNFQGRDNTPPFAGIGAIAGGNWGVIRHSSATGTIGIVGAGGAQPGGLVGANFARIESSFAQIKMKLMNTSANAGGLVGANEGSISASYATGSITSRSVSITNAGGLVGLNRGTIANAFAMTTINDGRKNCCQAYFGGLVGENDTTGQIRSSYDAGSLAQKNNQDSDLGGLVGFDQASSGSIVTSYWDLDRGVSDPAHGAGNPPNDPGITGLTTVQFQSELPTGLDPKVWSQDARINNGFPYLRAVRIK